MVSVTEDHSLITSTRELLYTSDAQLGQELLHFENLKCEMKPDTRKSQFKGLLQCSNGELWDF